MRPTLERADADSHLWPCPQCGSANGLNAHACWNCDAALPPPDDAIAPMPITAALEAQGVPMAAFEGNVAHPLSMASIEPRPAPPTKRRTLFEAAVARMNGEPDDPSDSWGEISSEALPRLLDPALDGGLRGGLDEPNADARLESAPSMRGRSNGDRSAGDDETAERASSNG